MAEVDLKELLSEYEKNLCDKTFRYELANGTVIDVVFYQEQFCHLLGIQHIFNEKKYDYIGKKGYEKIKNDDLTVKSLKSHNKNKFYSIKERLRNFDKLYQLILDGDLIKFYSDRTRPPTTISADFVIYHEETEHILHLFLRKESANSNIFAPVSFVIKSHNDKTPKQFINFQEYKKIVKREVISNK